MSSIISFSNTSNYVSNIGQTASANMQPPPAVDRDGDGDGDGQVQGHHGGHRGGGAARDLVDALKSLGLSLPQSGDGSGSSTDASSSSDGSSDSSTASTSDGGTVRSDMRAFMHSLFQAVRSEGDSSSSSGSTSAPADPKAAFASGLSALTTQVSNGDAPSDLQASFDKLMSDLQPAAGGSTPTLQQMLGALQQQVGYGSSASTGAVGSTVSATA